MNFDILPIPIDDEHFPHGGCSGHQGTLHGNSGRAGLHPSQEFHIQKLSAQAYEVETSQKLF
ncbi:MAG: hypothetical protein F6K63_29795 [Moorea sp. SIO1G6]|uniref:hypothetical protein n=1 Tax=Moorena sp. SIO1G6 TaxID=2607840 RepID=UPI0013C01D4B|nr:hypothetical protein [Moorena sp. SIO1G6]NET68363.1 hypothetical protein [Moorena sp. SIO1G6]